VIDEEELFRRGLEECVAQDPNYSMVFSASSGVPGQHVDLVIASPRAAKDNPFGCPILICADHSTSLEVFPGSRVTAILPRSTLTAELLLATLGDALT